MFESLQPAPPDAILGLTEAFQADGNPDKVNLAVGIFKDATGKTPVLQCVQAAGKRLLETETTKTYLGIEGLAEYRQLAGQLVFGGAVAVDRVALVQTPGGTGGLRVGADFLAAHHRGATVWLPSPTWENHAAVFSAAGLSTASYRYLNSDKTGLDFEGLLDDLQSKPRAGDVILLHACCHNPTGVDLSLEHWGQLAELLLRRQLLPFVDFAYQGFGSGLEQDAAGLATLLGHCPEALVASSFSKNFGLYSERVGTAALVAADAATATAGLSQLKRAIRCNYSNPPRHGAALVATVLSDPQLRQLWLAELADMRNRIADMRAALVQALVGAGAKRDFSFLLNQSGMFSYTGLNAMQCDELRSRHSLYIVGSGRINVAGLTPDNLDRVAAAIASVL